MPAPRTTWEWIVVVVSFLSQIDNFKLSELFFEFKIWSWKLDFLKKKHFAHHALNQWFFKLFYDITHYFGHLKNSNYRYFIYFSYWSLYARLLVLELPSIWKIINLPLCIVPKVKHILRYFYYASIYQSIVT